MKSNLTSPKLLSMIAITILSSIIFSSCQKSSVEAKPSSGNQQKQDLTNDAINASSSDDEDFDMVMGNGDYADVADAASGSASNAVANKLSGKTVTFSPSADVYPHTKTIDFGTGWTNSNGVIKSGKVIITYYAPPESTSGKYSVTTYDNYYSNGVKIEGSIRLDRIKDLRGKIVYLYTIDKTISDASGSVKKYIGAATWIVTDFQGGKDNAYTITEYTAGSETYNGVETSGFITRIDDTNPVIKPFTCKRVQGVLISDIHITNALPGESNNLEERLDYGNGECDDIATLSVNGSEPQTVTLPLRFWPLSF